MESAEKSSRLVFSLVANPGTTDARVMKQARVLQRAGYRVRIYGRQEPGFPVKEEVDGIEVVRFPCFSYEDLTVTDIELLKLVGPRCFNIFNERLRSLLSIAPDVRRARGERMEARQQLEAIAAEVMRLKEERIRLKEIITRDRSLPAYLRWLWALPLLRRFAPILAIGRDPDLRIRYKSIVQHLKEQTERRENAKNEVNRALAFEREIVGRPRSQDDIFFTRHAIFAIQFLKLDFNEAPFVIHAHDLYPLVGAVALASRTGAKVIFDAHEIETERVPPLAPERKEFIDLLERELLKRIDQVITCCDSSTEFYAQRFSTRTPEVIMNAPDFAVMSIGQEPLDLREKLSLPKRSPLVIYTGGVGREARGLDKVAAALRFLPAVHLVILGPRHRTNDAWLQDVAEREGVADRVHMLPSVPAEQVVPAIRSADVGVCPIQDVSLSYRYAMPNKLFEMAFASVPICVSNLPEMAKFVRELGIGVVMDQTNPVAIAEAINNVLQNRDRYGFTERSRVLLETKYSWSTQAQRLVGAYADLVGRVPHVQH